MANSNVLIFRYLLNGTIMKTIVQISKYENKNN